MIDRQFLGEGNEHKVWKSRYDSWVLKTPKLVNNLSLMIGRKKVGEILRAEISFNKERCNACKIKSPLTRVFPSKSGYVLLQQYIDEDSSLSIPEVFELISRDSYISSIYYQKPENFISSKRDLYMVDLTFGFTRILDSFGILSHEKQNLLKGQIFRAAKMTGNIG